MKKINLQNEIIVVSRQALLHALNSHRTFAITLEGTIEFEPFDAKALHIYRGAVASKPASPVSPAKPASIQELLGHNYRVVEDDERILLKASGAWAEILGYNRIHADYDDSTADGISDFSDKTLETIGWHATEFGISYREMAEFFETRAEGILLCIEIESPYQFSGLGFLRDHEAARTQLFEFCREKVIHLIASDPDYAPDRMTDDEREAAEYFNAC